MIKTMFHLASQFSASFREVTKDGSAILVVPGVVVVEKVLNFAFLPAEEIEKFFSAWNDRPLVIEHPRQNLGSAGSPEQLKIGRFYNAEYDASKKALRGEFWFEVDQLRKTDEGKQIEHNIRSGQMMEVSSAYFSDLEDVKGTWNDEDYFAIYRNLRPDHIAILMSDKGACSNADGCGVPRTNKKKVLSARGAVNKERRMKFPLFQNSKKPVKTQAVKVDLNDAEQVTALLEQAGFTITNEGDETLVQLSEVESETTPTPQAAPFMKELKEAFGEGGVAGFVTLLEDLRGIVDHFKAQQQAEETKKNALIEKLGKNAACPFSADEMKAFGLTQLQKIEQTLAPKVNFSGLGIHSNDTNDVIDPAPLPKRRGIGLSGTLARKGN